MADSCPPLERLEDIAMGQAPDAALAMHLESCLQCAQQLERICADNALVGELMSAHRGDAATAAPMHHDAVEGYELLKELHRGGQGVVYQAMQLSAKRVVAIKMLLQGAFATSTQRNRFEREVELVAQLRHPGIVTLYESGRTSSGQHYIAMEYIEGKRLDEHARTITPSGKTGPPRREALALFRQICEAVGYAHQRGIIHRDIKPGNILVDEDGHPHVLDFGIAKPLDASPGDEATTMAGEFVGTFGYAAPEQVSGDPAAVDLRTDVYALGVVLYELLIGRKPYELSGSVGDVVRTITETAPTPPRSLRPDLDRDIETILLKSLSKDANRRYRSAAALADDVELYLAGEPIVARRDSSLYVIRKTLWKHKVAAGTALAFLLLIVGSSITMTALFLDRSEKARRATRALDVVVEGLTTLDQETSNRRVSTIDELLVQFDILARNELDEFPDMQAAVDTALGLAYLDKRDLDQAIERMTRALSLLQAESATPRPALADAHKNLGRALWHAGRYEEAEAEFHVARAMWKSLSPEEGVEFAVLTQFLGSALENQGRYSEAESELRNAERLFRTLLPANHPYIANTLNSLGICYREQGDHQASYACFSQALEMLRSTLPANDFRIGRASHSVGTSLIELGRLDEAMVHLTESLRIKRLARGDRPWEIARTQYQLARLHLIRAENSDGLVRENSLRLATRLCHEAIEQQAASLPADNAELIASRALLAQVEALVSSDR